MHKAYGEYVYAYKAYTGHVEEYMSTVVMYILKERKKVFDGVCNLVQMTKCLHNKKCLWTYF